jgi:predicted deacetylase
MELVHAERVTALAAPARRILVSLHDVSPLTLAECQSALALFAEQGLSPSSLSLFVIPLHEGRVAVDQDPATMRFLRELGDAGATLVMHGLTHRMPGRAWTPGGWLRGHVFARGQGEFLRCDAADARRRLEEGAAIFRRAGLERALRGFIPPAWLLSPAAREVVAGAGFDFYEVFGGIVHHGRRLARRVIGWGSLSELEARATALYAACQVRFPTAADTRLAVHPADMARPSQRRAVGRALARLLPRWRAVSYETYLAAAA